MIGTKKLKISIVEPSGLLYGSELALLDILENIDRNKFEAEVLLPADAPFLSRLKEISITVLEKLPAACTTSRVRKLSKYVELWWHWFQRRPDVIYVNQAGILRPMGLIARILNVPIVCQVQTLEDAEWASANPQFHQNVFAFIANSNFIKARTKVASEKLSMVYYGYRPKGLSSNRRLWSEGRIEVGLLGRIGGSKGHDLVIEAARKLLETGDCEFHFRFIGSAPTPEMLSQFQKKVSDAEIEHLIEFRGYRKDIRSELEALDLMIIPSVAEPFGRIYCEAAESRLPVLVSDGGGLGELAAYFAAGLTFESGNVSDFVSQLQYIRGNYHVVEREFNDNSVRMLSRLDLMTYVGVIERVIENAGKRSYSSIVWQGTE